MQQQVVVDDAITRAQCDGGGSRQRGLRATGGLQVGPLLRRGGPPVRCRQYLEHLVVVQRDVPLGVGRAIRRNVLLQQLQRLRRVAKANGDGLFAVASRAQL